MKHIKSFKLFEGIIDFDTENIKLFYQELKDKLLTNPSITFDEMVEVGEKNDIEVVNYNTFYSELPEDEKKTAPPKGRMRAFALVNPISKKARIVMDVNKLNKELLNFIYHMLKHENVHVGQHNRGGLLKLPPNPESDRVGYFSNKDEVMAFSQSIVDMLKDTCKTKKEALNSLKYNGLYRDIKGSVDSKTLKRYHKYIYLYLCKQYDEKSYRFDEL